eukprot:TRINITY_DN12062_c0_g1_i1.p1 TRINITY_DN12062_c0_g1~~TRINITY_DN12062_c0_g1_i1.p1  ORF type:complete len:279 (+),score=62.46 TRINITY_DN12062_c0_g1_i1:64-900(+)
MPTLPTVAEYTKGVDTVICDIEGTTTPIPFVSTVLFPYSTEKAGAFLEANFNEVTDIINGMRSQAETDGGDVPQIRKAEGSSKKDIISDVVENLKHNVKLNRKLTSMKDLQGKIWKDGYASGDLKGAVFDDVAPAFKRWSEMGKKVHIYSSGSVAAQKLIFGWSSAGDLLPHLTNHFDLSTTGNKRETVSYTKIANDLKKADATDSLLFLTDMVPEATAAREAGFKVMLLDRPENLVMSEDDTETAKSMITIKHFNDIFPSKRQREESPPSKKVQKQE